MELLFKCLKVSCSLQYPTSLEINPYPFRKEWGHLLTRPGEYVPRGISKSCFYIVLLLDESWKSPVTLRQSVLRSTNEVTGGITQSDIRAV